MILTHINISPELFIKLIPNKLRLWAEGYFPSLGKSSASLGRIGWEVLGDQWRGIAFRS